MLILIVLIRSAPNVRFGSLADLSDDISSTAAFGGIADVQRAEKGQIGRSANGDKLTTDRTTIRLAAIDFHDLAKTR